MFPDTGSRSAQLFAEAAEVMPGANTRHMITFAPYLVYAERGEGCMLYDVDGNRYIDWVNNFSSQIHGHAHPEIVAAIREQVGRLTSCILPTEPELRLAQLIVSRMPAVDQVRFTNSGTEAAMVALKGARALTGRTRIAKCEGGYHGQYDLVEASFLPTPENWGPLERPAVTPSARGVPQSLLDQVVVIPFNDTERAVRLLEEHRQELAAVIIDPIPARLGFVGADPGYLAALRRFCDESGALLIYDEVFCNRIGYHGAQGHVGVLPDMTVMGKIIGGGLPIGAVGGTREAMSVFDNLAGPLRVSHSGTFTANPLSMTAGIVGMTLLMPEVFERLAAQGERLRAGLNAALREAGIEARCHGQGSMSCLQFFREDIRNYREFYLASGPDYLARMLQMHRCMLQEGVLIATRGMLIGSTPMTDEVIDETIERSRRAFCRFAAQDGREVRKAC